MTKLQAIKDRIVLKRFQVEQKTKSGIVLIEDKPLHHSNYAKVVSVGSDVKTLKEGDTVLIPNWNKADFKIGAEDYIAMTEADVLAVVKLDRSNEAS